MKWGHLGHFALLTGGLVAGPLELWNFDTTSEPVLVGTAGTSVTVEVTGDPVILTSP